MELDVTTEPLGVDAENKPVYLKDIWPSSQEIQQAITEHVKPEMFTEKYADVYTGDENWRNLPVEKSQLYGWPESGYVRRPPFFDDITMEVYEIQPIATARWLAQVVAGNNLDHISS